MQYDRAVKGLHVWNLIILNFIKNVQTTEMDNTLANISALSPQQTNVLATLIHSYETTVRLPGQNGRCGGILCSIRNPRVIVE